MILKDLKSYMSPPNPKRVNEILEERARARGSAKVETGIGSTYFTQSTMRQMTAEQLYSEAMARSMGNYTR